MSVTVDERLVTLEESVEELQHLADESVKLGVANRDNTAIIAYRLSRVEYTQYEHGRMLREHGEALRDVRATLAEHGGLLHRILAKLDGPAEKAG